MTVEDGDYRKLEATLAFRLGFPELERLNDPQRKVVLAATTRLVEECGSAAAALARLDITGRLSADEADLTKEHPGRYSITSVHGKGGQSTVYLAYDSHIGREVALKQLGARKPDDVLEPLRFLREARITARLEHPNVVPVYEVGTRQDGSMYYTMKLVRGTTLQEALQKTPELEERLKLLRHFEALCFAVAFAHEHGYIHRDIKPPNVMIGSFNETILLDWGIARSLHTEEVPFDGELRVEAADLTMQGSVVGSLGYMSPEQASGRTEAVDVRSDVWSLGAVLYAILAGESPLFKGSRTEQFLKAREGEYPPLSRHLPRELTSIVDKAMQRDPARRYQTARELAEDIVAYRDGRRISAHRYSPLELGLHWFKHTRIGNQTVVVAAFLLMLLWALAWGVHGHHEAMRAENMARVAQTERQAARDAENISREFARTLLVDLARRLENIPGTRDVRLTMLDRARQYLEALGRRSDWTPADISTIAHTYRQLAGVARELRQFPEAYRMHQTDYRLSQSLSAPSSALALVEWAWTAAAAGDYDQAEEMGQRALESLDRIRSQPGEWELHIWKITRRLADVALARGEYHIARQRYETALKLMEARHAADPGPWNKTHLAQSETRYGELDYIEGRRADFERRLQRAEGLYREARRAPDVSSNGDVTARYCRVLCLLARHGEALPQLRLLYERDAENTYHASLLMEALIAEGRTHEAEKVAAGQMERLRGADPADLFSVQVMLLVANPSPERVAQARRTLAGIRTKVPFWAFMGLSKRLSNRMLEALDECRSKGADTRRAADEVLSGG